MTKKPVDLGMLGDAALAELARARDVDAFAELWRRHVGAGTTAARQFSGIADPQDIVSESYLRILRALQQGGGPHEAFRPYLYRTIRNIALDWRSRHPTLSLEETGDLVELGAPMDLAVLDNAVTSAAFEQLPERWQAVLWYLEVEGMSPAEAAPLLGLKPNATSALAARAQEGFKAAWLQAHVNDRSVPTECSWTTQRMGRYIRRSLSRRSRTRFDAHVADCDRCGLLLLEIENLGGHLASLLLPITLGATAGSLLLVQLRDQTAVAAATLAPAAAPAAAGVLSAAAVVVLIASGAVLNVDPLEQQAPSSAEAGELPAGSTPTEPADGQPSSPLEPPPGHPEPGESVDADPGTDATETTPAPNPDPDPTPDPDPGTPEGTPLIDVSVSLLSGTVELDAGIDLDPETGLIVTLLPGVSLFGR